MSDILLNVETRRYKLRGLTPILGGQPANPAVRTQYISSRAPAPGLGEEEDSLLNDLEEKGLTVFMRDEDNRLLLMDYMLKGFFKSALGAIKAQVDVAQERAKVDKFLFIAPRRIPLKRNGMCIIDEDQQLERPLRASTMKGERVTLAASEMVEDPWVVGVRGDAHPQQRHGQIAGGDLGGGRDGAGIRPLLRPGSVAKRRIWEVYMETDRG